MKLGCVSHDDSVCFPHTSTLFYEISQAISTEARAMNNVGQAGLTFFAPNINIYRYCILVGLYIRTLHLYANCGRDVHIV